MAYVLETITSEDQEKILKDAECDEEKHGLLRYAKDHVDFPETWAIDYQRNYYMLIAPVIVRPDEPGGAIFFYFKGFLFEICIESPFGNKIKCIDKPSPSIFF
ncbi:hypothetical protein [Methylocucumis oryzae]|uniref:Uncharacterized protein n=1 Tax=Methylocucumis oryzae TaxID=1632867 RepID=A0A0F3IEV8_9GAMM|nr:hypothetical protein [Methylocucumis oryzae]KJV05286.1 hypothetical protein VZ94_19190 [Methylocucumis oryzae]